ncbi:MAG: hypothetical protein HKN17_04450, partial [Rhodothermales bacterium]|nr:hypothetical protein [Rhodothermales bacterium]
MPRRRPGTLSGILSATLLLLISLIVRPALAQSGDENWSGIFGEPGMGTGGREGVVVGGELFVSDATYVGAGLDRAQFAVWNGTGWRTTGDGALPNGEGINDMAAVGTDVYIAGNFTSIGGVDASYVARWDGTTWQALGAGVNGSVNALASDGQNLYVGGTFTDAGGVAVRNVARWDGAAWSALTNGPASSEGVNGPVSALAVGNSRVYVGGGFTEAGQQAATSVAS